MIKKAIPIIRKTWCIIGILLLISVIVTYVYIGTYVFPIAPYWVTQLPPNPLRPQVEYGEFSFSLTYEINGKQKVIKDVWICKFDGFRVNGVGEPKRRSWSDFFKNQQKREILGLENSGSRNTKIVLENIDTYKVVLGVDSAEYFMGEPEYKTTSQMPYIQVYDTLTGYYKDPEDGEQFLNECGFEILSWYCDQPIRNSFESDAFAIMKMSLIILAIAFMIIMVSKSIFKTRT